MICCQFVFEPGDYDDEFRALDSEIAEFARSMPGFVNVHSWRSKDGQLVNATYFFQDNESVKALAQYPTHLAAKKSVDRWYKGYQILITEVMHSYGDGNIQYP